MVLHVKTQTIGTFWWDIFLDGVVAFSAFAGAICKSPLRRWWFNATILCTGLGMIIHSSK